MVQKLKFVPTYPSLPYKFTIEDDWGRCLHVHDFIWECFHGLLKGEKIKHINKRRDDNRLENMQLRSSNDIVIRGFITYV